MAKFKLGDIFGIPTSRGKAYFQCVYSNKLEGELIKVFNNVFEQPLESIEELLNVEDFFFVGFPLKAALNRKIVEKVGVIPIPSDFKKPRYSCSGINGRTKEIIS